MDTQISSIKQCPYCGEEIHAEAQKCKHCNEWLVKNPPLSPNKSAAPVKQDTPVQTFFGCLVMLLGVLGLPILFVIIAALSVPDETQHKQSIQEDVIKCVEDEADQWLGFLGGTLLSPFVSMVINTEFAQQNIKECFYKENTIRITESKFWSTGKIYNRLHPEGTTVSFGIFGFVFPFVDWDDIVLMTEENKAKLSRIFSQKAQPEPQASEKDETPEEISYDEDEEATLILINGAKNYRGNIKGIHCHFNLYFENPDNKGLQNVHGKYYYDKQGVNSTIILQGVYNPKTETLDLVEYFDDGRSNSTITVRRSIDGFSGIFTKVNGNELPITMTE